MDGGGTTGGGLTGGWGETGLPQVLQKRAFDRFKCPQGQGCNATNIPLTGTDCADCDGVAGGGGGGVCFASSHFVFEFDNDCISFLSSMGAFPDNVDGS